MTEWIKDRNPKSPGIYLTNQKLKPGCLTIRNLLCFFDGTNWFYPYEIGEEPRESERNIEWMKIELGKD